MCVSRGPTRPTEVYGIRESNRIRGFELGFVDSNLDSWIRTWIRGFELGFVDSNLDSWIRTWIRGFEAGFVIRNWIRGFRTWIRGFQLGFVDSNLDSWIPTWIRGFEAGFVDSNEDSKLDSWICSLLDLVLDWKISSRIPIVEFQVGLIDFKLDSTQHIWILPELSTLCITRTI